MLAVVGPGVMEPGVHVDGGGNHVKDVGLAPAPIRRGHSLAELVDPGRRLGGIGGVRVHCGMVTGPVRDGWSAGGHWRMMPLPGRAPPAKYQDRPLLRAGDGIRQAWPVAAVAVTARGGAPLQGPVIVEPDRPGCEAVRRSPSAQASCSRSCWFSARSRRISALTV